MKTIVVIDGNFIAHLCRFTNRIRYKGKECGVILKIFEMILDCSMAYDTESISIVWDSKHSWRKKKHSWYKEKRTQDRKELTDQEKKDLRSMYEQVDKLMKILPQIGFQNSFMQNGIEGDDLMAMICRNYPTSKIVLVASDHDLYQLIDNNVSILTPKGEYLGKEYRKKDFEEEFGISPSKWHLVKAIAGCISDEVPGVGRDIKTHEIVARIGEKTACNYLAGKLQNTTKAFQRIVCDEGQQIIDRNLELVRLPHQKTKPIILKRNKIDKIAFLSLCHEYKFMSFINERIDEWERFFRKNENENSQN